MASARSTTRTNGATNLWTRPASPVQFGREQFRFRIQRTARRLPSLDIDPWVETATWQRSGSNRTGELNFRRPLGAHTASMIAYGDELLCEWAQWDSTGPWARLWRMKVATPSHQIKEGIIALALSGVLDSLTKSKVAWKFRVDKAHPHGWTAEQITLNVCQRFHIPIGHIPKGTWRVSKYVPKSASPEDVITWAWGQEKTHTGRRFDVDSSTGVLNVTEIAEPQYLLIMGASMLDATVTQSLTGIASAVVATATHKVKGKKDTKLRARVVDAAREARYGYIVKTVHAPAGIQSVAALRKWAKDRLASLYASKKQLTFSHPGVPLVDRGTALRAYLPEADLDQIVFVTSVEHDLSAGSYEMQVTVGFDDPWKTDQRKARAQQKKDAAAARRHRTSTAKTTAPTAKKAATRSNT
jgi:hypothetical protein